jgi:hypothetical protein
VRAGVLRLDRTRAHIRETVQNQNQGAGVVHKRYASEALNKGLTNVLKALEAAVGLHGAGEELLNYRAWRARCAGWSVEGERRDELCRLPQATSARPSTTS